MKKKVFQCHGLLVTLEKIGERQVVSFYDHWDEDEKPLPHDLLFDLPARDAVEMGKALAELEIPGDEPLGDINNVAYNAGYQYAAGYHD
jgi:hypothetical protein